MSGELLRPKEPPQTVCLLVVGSVIYVVENP